MGLQTVRKTPDNLEYKQWRRFCNVIDKAKEACQNSDFVVSDHFADVGKMVKAGVAPKDIGDIALSRYACYLNIPDYFTPPVRSLGTTIPVYGYH